MTILNVAYPFAPVSLDAVGGAEQVLAMIDNGLVDAGVESIVIGAEGSRTRGVLIELPASQIIDDDARSQTYHCYTQAILATIAQRRVDLVHMHGVDFAHYIPDAGVPVLVTLHLPLDYYQHPLIHWRHTVFNAVSEWQRRQCAVHIPVELVCNGVDTEALSPVSPKEDFVLALGRICPEKGFHLALDAAAYAGMNCILAGQVYGYADHRRYFSQEILPRLNGHRRFIGPAAGALKRRLLSAAKCVLIPSLVDESSSLVGMEALACGTPVVAFRRGALTEIVSHQRTGFLVDDVEQMAEAIRQVHDIDVHACREDACQRFSAKQMVRNYLHLYKSILGTA
ncbi:MAG: glycosyltransferase [Deltaproteobacteria bacterium]|nr:glycosyltransferase [Deltaproteobacteria bacterium]